MYKISVPIMCATVCPANRETYVRQCRKAGATRVFLCTSSPMEPLPANLRENVAYFKEQGFEVGIWTDTIGHGFVLTHAENTDDGERFTSMVNILGESRAHAFCPMDAGFRRYIAAHIGVLAGTGADIVMLDDDFRMSQHGDILCCACPAHLHRIGEILGETVTREELRPYLVSGKENKYRSAWMQAQNEGLVALATEIRAEVDRVAPTVTVCTCTAYAPWNVDGADLQKISQILAGKNHPILRLTGAPYWAVKKRRFPLISVFEIARMLAAFCREWDCELMSEGDVYPRPRYTCPASYLELYDAVTRADGGYNGILKYMFDYVSGPEMETGYLKLHGADLPFLDQICTLFSRGVNAGVRVICQPHTMRHADLDLSELRLFTPLPAHGALLGHCGIPTVHGRPGMCNAVFGEHARLLDIGELACGTVLDAVSAVILTQRGVDVGLASYELPEWGVVSFLCDERPESKTFIQDGKVRLLPARLQSGARTVLWSCEADGNRPLAYTYENAWGQRFFVLLFEGESMYAPTASPVRVCDSGLMQNYVMQQALIRQLPWVARQPLPAYCEGNPCLYVMCAKGEGEMSVALFNCFADEVTQPVIVLDKEYRQIECFGCAAVLEGDRIRLTERLHGFCAAAFRVIE